MYALSLYRSQNNLGWFKYFVLDQKLNFFQCHSKLFCAGTKTKSSKCKSSFGLAQKFWDCHNIQLNFGTCRFYSAVQNGKAINCIPRYFADLQQQGSSNLHNQGLSWHGCQGCLAPAEFLDSNVWHPLFQIPNSSPDQRKTMQSMYLCNKVIMQDIWSQ